jgi:phospholipase/carboxylesterase
MDADPGNRDDLFTMLETVEIVTASNPTGTVLWMHGLGADGHDFEPVVPELVERGERGLRFVFPHAPVRPVTWNAGYRMRAWYDILSLERGAAQDEAGTRESAAAIAELIAREGERGIAPERIAVAGFSQGGALALYFGTRFTQRLAGIAGLSCYLPLADRLDAERAAANQATPIFLAHGSYARAARRGGLRRRMAFVPDAAFGIAAGDRRHRGLAAARIAVTRYLPRRPRAARDSPK